MSDKQTVSGFTLMFLEQTNAPFLRLLIFPLYGFIPLMVVFLCLGLVYRQKGHSSKQNSIKLLKCWYCTVPFASYFSVLILCMFWNSFNVFLSVEAFSPARGETKKRKFSHLPLGVFKKKVSFHRN